MLKSFAHMLAAMLVTVLTVGWTSGALAQSQQLLPDKSSVTSGPGAVVRIGNFSGASQAPRQGNTVINITSGTFRFVSGTAAPENYTIKTPLATLGVRGTVIEGTVTPELEVFVLIEGSFQICTARECQLVTKLGSYTVVRPDGSISTPIECDGTLLEINASVDHVRKCIARHSERGWTREARPNGCFNGAPPREYCVTYNDGTARQCFPLPAAFFSCQP